MRKIIAGTAALLMAAACSNLSQYTTYDRQQQCNA